VLRPNSQVGLDDKFEKRRLNAPLVKDAPLRPGVYRRLSHNKTALYAHHLPPLPAVYQRTTTNQTPGHDLEKNQPLKSYRKIGIIIKEKSD
jgi:hypothetical protein